MQFITAATAKIPKGLMLQIFGVVLVLITSRILVRAIGITPNESFIVNGWQHLNLTDLNNALLHSLYSLHSQPPLWNLLLGLFSKVCGGELSCVVTTGWYFNLALTLFSSAGIFLIFSNFLRIKWSMALVAVYIILPSTIFYENYIFYPHLTNTLMVYVSLFLIKYSKTGSFLYFTLTLIAGVLLCFTWSLFHPIFIGILYVCLLVLIPRKSFSKYGVIVVLAALVVSLVPSFKNFIELGIFSNGSWVGLNLAQVAPLHHTVRDKCSFNHFLKEKKIETTSQRNGTILNDPSIVPLSKECARLSLYRITREPDTYVLGRIEAVISSMSLLPHNYFKKPHNWEAIGVFDITAKTGLEDEHGNVDYLVVCYRLGVLLFYVFILLISVFSLVKFKNSENWKIILVILFLMAWFLAFAHAFNDAEQQRMRWSIEFMFPLLLVLSLLNYEVMRHKLA